MAKAIEDYALIGDCETAALVSRDGSLDWLCWPRFDSPACFASLLGEPKNGRWKIAPSGKARVARRYRPHTLVLETEFETAEGRAALIDFMPNRTENSDVVRLVEGRSGHVRMDMELIIRFDYGLSVPWVTRLPDGGLRAIAGPNLVILRTPVPLKGADLTTRSSFSVREGETIPFVLTYGESFRPVPRPIDWKDALESTEAFWVKWSGQCDYLGRHAEAVERSLIVLKALTYRHSGGIVAAPTTSLPETLGGNRNWDYRFCWLRDAAFTLLALANAGYHSEAAEWQSWLRRAVAGSPEQVQTLYGVAGERQLDEQQIPWLAGYEKSSPVRIGNAASNQIQLDIYGELADAFGHASQHGKHNNSAWQEIELGLLNYLEKIWREPDEGIWEVRGHRRNFTYSKIMAWVAFDQAIKHREQSSLGGPLARWRTTREEIFQDVCRNGFDAELGSFVQSYGSKQLDASLLRIPLVGFLSGSDPRVLGTVAAIEKQLMKDGFVLRYRTENSDDGMEPGEGAFLACSFWLADNYILQNRRDDAERLLERLLALRNDVGLLSEEYDLRRKRLLGNFPQALTHVSLINSILNLTREHGPAHQRSEVHRRAARA
ncbi:MAG TPA: glycoside hydrolase family 15 protein [Terriglobales bacterium]|nr:glycoside hydrolase family 15 protein [Terriglobales bacterium]